MPLAVPGHDFRVGDPVSVTARPADGVLPRRGRVVALADDAPLLLIRWQGGRICDWKKADELIHVAEADVPSSTEGEGCPVMK